MKGCSLFSLHFSEKRQEHRLQLWIPVVISALWSSSTTFMLSFSLLRTWGELGFRVQSASAFCFRLFSVSCHSYPSAITWSEFLRLPLWIHASVIETFRFGILLWAEASTGLWFVIENRMFKGSSFYFLTPPAPHKCDKVLLKIKCSNIHSDPATGNYLPVLLPQNEGHRLNAWVSTL